MLMMLIVNGAMRRATVPPAVEGNEGTGEGGGLRR